LDAINSTSFNIFAISMNIELTNLTLADLDRMFLEFEQYRETIEDLFRQVTGQSMGKCMACRREAYIILHNYIVQRDERSAKTETRLEEEGATQHTPRRGRRPKGGVAEGV
jgi:hypothetical protein